MAFEKILFQLGKHFFRKCLDEIARRNEAPRHVDDFIKTIVFSFILPFSPGILIFALYINTITSSISLSKDLFLLFILFSVLAFILIVYSLVVFCRLAKYSCFLSDVKLNGSIFAHIEKIMSEAIVEKELWWWRVGLWIFVWSSSFINNYEASYPYSFSLRIALVLIISIIIELPHFILFQLKYALKESDDLYNSTIFLKQ